MAAQGAALQNHNNELVRCTYFTTPRALMRTAGGGGGRVGDADGMSVDKHKNWTVMTR